MAEITFAAFLREHYTPYAFSTKRSASWEQIIFRVHLVPAFGDMPLHTIGRASITALVIAKQKAGYKPGTINRILANLRVVLSKALEWEIGGLEINAAKQVKGLRDPPHLDRYLSQIEAQRLMRSLEAGSSAMLRFIVPFCCLPVPASARLWMRNGASSIWSAPPGRFHSRNRAGRATFRFRRRP